MSKFNTFDINIEDRKTIAFSLAYEGTVRIARIVKHTTGIGTGASATTRARII